MVLVRGAVAISAIRRDLNPAGGLSGGSGGT
jgi:hypothetical protein